MHLLDSFGGINLQVHIFLELGGISNCNQIQIHSPKYVIASPARDAMTHELLKADDAAKFSCTATHKFVSVFDGKAKNALQLHDDEGSKMRSCSIKFNLHL